MMKKAIGLLAAFAIAVSGSASAFAEQAEDTDSAYSESSSYGEDNSGEEVGGDTDTEESETSDERLEAEQFAEENCDPQYGKYLETVDQPLTSFAEMDKEAGGGDDAQARSGTRAYTNNSLIHNSRFDNMDKVWGIDVSYFQYDINWNKVKADGIDYAIIRVGYRGYGSGGQLVLDYKFDENMREAIAAGVEVGVYFYTQAINTAEAVAEADFVLSHIKNYKLDLPVYFDIESVDYDVGRLDSANLTKAQKTALCTAFCDRIESKGYEAGVYANKSWLTYQIDGAALGKKYDIWLAHYTNKTDYTGVYNTWQFTGSGKVSGINTAVDIDVDYRDTKAEEVTVGEIENFKLTLSGSNAVFKWDAAKNATRYEVFRYNPTSRTYSKIINTTSTTATVALISGNYGYCVRAVRASGGVVTYSGYSQIIYASKDKITGLTATATSKSVTISWNKLPAASGYEIYYAKSSGSNASYTRYKTLTSNSYTVNGLKPGAYYSYKVRPYFTSGSKKTYGSFSSAVSATVKPEKINAPKHTSSTSSTVAISWKSLDYVDGYQIAFYNASTKQYEIKSTVSSSTCSAVLTGLSPATSYRIAVRSYITVNGSRCYSDYSSYRTCGTAPSAPKNLYAKSTPATVTLTWDAVSGATQYTVYKKENGKYTEIDTVSSTSCSFANEGGYPQTYTVKASTVINTKKLSSSYSAQSVLPNKAPDTPVISSSAATGSTVQLRWTTCPGVSGYRVYKYDAASNSYVKIKTLYGDDTVSYTATKLDSSTRYRFKVKAFTKTSTGIAWGKSSSVYYASTARK